MASITVTYSFSNSTTADATQVNQNFTDIINGTSDGTKDFAISALTCAGNVNLNGNTTIGNASSDDLTITASLASSLPIKTNDTYDIGTSTIGLRNLYLAVSGAASKTVSIDGGAAADNYTLTVPTLTASDTIAVLALAQTFTGAKTFSSTSHVIGSSTNISTFSSGNWTFRKDNAGGDSVVAYFFNGSANANTAVSVYLTPHSSNGREAVLQAVTGGSGDITFNLQTSNGGAAATRLTVSPAGVVGIGSTNAVDGEHLIYNSSTGSGTLKVRNQSTNTASDDDAAITVVKGSTTTSTSQIFMKFNYNAGTDWGGVRSNGTNGPEFYNASDKRLKDNITPLANALQKILSLKPVSFRMKEAKTTGAGFLAQDFAEVFPEKVNKPADDDGLGDNIKSEPWTMSDSGLIPYLVKAVQELNSKGGNNGGQPQSERVSTYTAATSFPANNVWGDLGAGVDLTPGDWIVDVCVSAQLNGATMTGFAAGFSLTKGAAFAGQEANDFVYALPPTAQVNNSLSISGAFVSVNKASTLNLKYLALYSAGSPRAMGTISARKIK